MTVYGPADIDLWIESAREWERRTGSLPDSMVNVLERLTQEDLRLMIYAHHRILRYPRLKTAFVAFQNRDDPATDDQPPGPVEPARIPALMAPGAVVHARDPMYH